MAISKRLRFQILRRDRYCCFYCGRRAPAVILEIDHRIPRAAGGSDAPTNLVTACWDCNRGKGPLDAECPDTEDDPAFDRFREHWYAGDDFPDELPSWMNRRRDRSPLVFHFDIYAAAEELCPARMVYADTLDSVMRRAEAF